MEMDKEEEEADEGQEEKFSNSSHSALSMYRDWVLSFRRPGCSRLLRQNLKAPLPGVKA